ncbi:ATP-binding protein [Candidatus Poribacteria bacterium]|nr:ATP-binding protein [Candidatus Poribacteria bacterium]
MRNKNQEIESILPLFRQLLEKADSLLNRLDARTVHAPNECLNDYIAFQWRSQNGTGALVPVKHPHLVDSTDLIGINSQWTALDRNTRQFLQGLPANHVLLWGDRGTGKSSLVKAILERYADKGLRLVGIGKEGLVHLQEIAEMLWERPERYVLFCDDLAFNEDEPEYRELKAMLEGGISACPDNVLIYATSNRRHLMPRLVGENQYPQNDEDELYPREATEEKVSLSDRFGLRLAFYRISQDTYLQIVSHYAQKRGLSVPADTLRRAALEWAASSSGRSGRVAYQFVADLAGRLSLEAHTDAM